VGDRGSLIVPIFEWAWPYIEQIYSGVLDTMLRCREALCVDPRGRLGGGRRGPGGHHEGRNAGTHRVIAAGWTAIATGIEFVGQGIRGFVYGLWKNHRAVGPRTLFNKMIDLINGFIQQSTASQGKGRDLSPTIGHISLKADKIEIPKNSRLQRWSETSFSKESR